MPLTTKQQHVFNALEQAGAPLSAYGLLDRLRERGFSAPMQVYRALERLIEYGLVHRLESVNAYVSCNHPGSCEHGITAFAICERCGQADEFVTADLGPCLWRWARDNAFDVNRTTIELRGLCAACAGIAPPQQI